MSNDVYNALGLIPVLKEAAYELLECGALTLETICNVDHELKDIDNFDAELDHQLLYKCQDLINKIVRLQNITKSLEICSGEMLEFLRWDIEYDEKREHWFVIDNKGDHE